MSNVKTADRAPCIELEYQLDHPPQKVWRALNIPEFRDSWLPKETLADDEAASVTPGEEVRYRLRESEPPFLESVVTFQIAPNTSGGTRLRVLHELTENKPQRLTTRPANHNAPPLKLAA